MIPSYGPHPPSPFVASRTTSLFCHQPTPRCNSKPLPPWLRFATKLFVVLACKVLLDVVVMARAFDEKEAKRRAKESITKYCVDPSLPFVKCQRKVDGDFDIMAGAFGAGVKAVLLNNPAFGVQVFRSCPGAKGKRWLPTYSPECALDPQRYPQIAVFLKILQDTAERSNAWSVDAKEFSAFQKEVQRTRVAGHLTWRDSGIRLAPQLVEVMDLNTKQPHPVQAASYSQELLDGVNADAVRNHILGIERDTIFGQLGKLAVKYEQGGDPAKLDAFLHVVDTELWMRFRLYLKLLDSIFEITQELHSRNVVHCDLHFGNILVLKTYITDANELLRRMEDGSAVIPGLQAFYSRRVVSKTMLKKLQQRHPDGHIGIPAYILEPTSIRLIDAAYMLSINESQMSAPPCLFYRAQRQEDLNELWRGGMDLMFVKYRGEGMFKSQLPRVRRAYERQWSALEAARPDLIQRAEESFLKTRQVLADLGQRVKAVPELAGCQKIKFPPQKIKNLLLHRRRDEASQLMAAQCDFPQQKNGIVTIRAAVQAALAEVPHGARGTFSFGKPPQPMSGSSDSSNSAFGASPMHSQAPLVNGSPHGAVHMGQPMHQVNAQMQAPFR